MSRELGLLNVSLARAWGILLKAFLPSWNFFESLGAVAWAEYRWVSQPGALEEEAWRQIDPPVLGAWWELFLNPRGNEYLALQSLVERWLSEDEDRDVQAEWTERILEEKLRSLLREQNGKGVFQFRIQVIEPDESLLARDVRGVPLERYRSGALEA